MMHTAELGSALRYRYKSVVSVFLLVTCTCWWLFANHAAQRTVHNPAAFIQAATATTSVQTQQLTAPTVSEALTSAITPLVPSAAPEVLRQPAYTATRNPAQVKQLQASLWSAIERKNSIESRLAELAIPAAPIVRVAPAIASVSPEVRAATARVAAAKTNLTELQTRYTDAYPDVVQAKDELTEAEQALYAARHLASSAPVKARQVVPTPSSPQVEAERATLRSELAGLADTIPDLKSQLEAASALPRRPAAPVATREPGYWPLVLPHSEIVPAPSSAAPSTTATLTSPPASATPTSVLSAHSLLFLPQSLLLGLIASGILFAVLESLDGTVKGPESLREALPAEARQLSLRSMRA